MKRSITITFTLLLFVSSINLLYSQQFNCDEVAGSHGMLDVFTSEQPINVSILDIAISGASTSLPTFEYALSDPNKIVGEGPQEGYEVQAASENGTFDLASLGFSVGDTFCINGVFYDLPNLKEIMDDLFNGVLIGQPCCDLMEVLLSEDICQNLNNAGIDSQDDVNSLADVIVSLGAFGAPASIEGVLDIIDNTFNVLVGAPAECAGNLPICYSITSRECLTVGPELTVGVQDIPGNTFNLAIAPNPVSGSRIAVKLMSESKAEIEATVFDITGKIMSTTSFTLNSGINELEIPAVNMPVGNYILSVNVDGNLINKSFVIQ